MEKSNKVELGSVQETLLPPLWARAVETQKKKPLLIDNKAVSVVNNIPYDFTSVSKSTHRFVQREVIARSIYFDNKIKAFIDLFPEATIINIGCGFDTTFYRVDNGRIKWIDLDLPDVIDLRKEYFSESNRNRFIPKSILDTSWYDSIERKDHVMLLIAGVLFYLDESQVKRLFSDLQKHLPGAEMVFDSVSKLSVKIMNKTYFKKAGMDNARWFWGINNIYEIEKWNYGLKVIESIPIFKEHKRYYPLIDRIIMSIFDVLKVDSLAHVKIHPQQDS